jgi:hypothetical protein
VQCSAVQCTLLCCAVLYCAVLYCAVLCCTVLYCTLLCCAVLYCTVLCCTAHLKSYPLFRVTYCTCLLMPRNSEILLSTLSTLLYLVDTSADFLPPSIICSLPYIPIFLLLFVPLLFLSSTLSPFISFSSYLRFTESLLKFCSFSYYFISSHHIYPSSSTILSSLPPFLPLFLSFPPSFSLLSSLLSSLLYCTLLYCTVLHYCVRACSRSGCTG